MEHIQAAIQKAKQRRIEDPLDEPTALPTSLFGTEATWSALKPLDLDPKHLARNRIVTASRIDPAHTQFDRLRTNLLQLIRQNNWTSVAITSPTAGCGKTLVSLKIGRASCRERV